MYGNLGEKLKGVYLEKVRRKCVFCHILEEEDEKILFRNEKVAVFPPLKSGALKEGHLLFIPVEHHESLFDMDQGDATRFFRELHGFLNRVKDKTRYSSVNLLSANGSDAQQSVRHLHFHVVLREEDDGYDLWPETGYGGEKFEAVNRELGNLLG